MAPWHLLILAVSALSFLYMVEGQDENSDGSTDFRRCFYAPYECPNKNISYWLYTRSTQENPYELNLDNFKEAPYAEDAPFVVLIHGYTGYRDYAPNPELRPAFFGLGEYNIISLDWGALAKEPCYLQAAYNVDVVGNCTTRLLLTMMKEMPQRISRDNLKIVGFSLGAQVSGSIGKYFKKLGNFTVKDMVGLDPALPLFDSITVGQDSRLSPDDADFLQVVHTNAGNKGIINPAGSVDFYMNKASYQPGCNGNSSCDHYRAVLYYAESMNKTTRGFWGTPCTLHRLTHIITGVSLCRPDSGAQTDMIMGFYTPRSARGNYQVMTNSSAPFGLGKNPNSTVLAEILENSESRNRRWFSLG